MSAPHLDEADRVRERELADLRRRLDAMERQRSVLLAGLVMALAALALGGGPDALRWVAGALGLAP